MSIVCLLFGHRREYTDEYENDRGFVQADRVCTRCNDRERAWVGPRAEDIRENGFDVPEEQFDP